MEQTLGLASLSVRAVDQRLKLVPISSLTNLELWKAYVLTKTGILIATETLRLGFYLSECFCMFEYLAGARNLSR
jgi:hypothetical protein